MDDEPRQAYGLGSIVKKATRAIKKVAKSDLGKAAIAAASIYYLGGGGSPFTAAGRGGFSFGNLPGAGFFSGTGASVKAKAAAAGLSPRDYMMGVGGKERAGASLLGKLGISKAGLGILAASSLPLFMGDEEEEQAELSPYLTEGLDIEGIRANPRLAQGRAFRLQIAEGGSTEKKEPVAKKVMPLIDMDGKEKDYRETGGFYHGGHRHTDDTVVLLRS